MIGDRSSRRSAIRRAGATCAAFAIEALLAACGGESLSSSRSASTTAPDASRPVTTSAARPAATGPATPAKRGRLAVWFNANWNGVTDAAVGDVFKQWGKERGYDVDYQVLEFGQDEKLSAALQSGQPPDVDQAAASVYWWKLDALVELTDLYDRLKDRSGGMLPVGHDAVASQNKVFGITYAIDGWAVHQRKSLLGQANDGKWPATWEEYNQIASRMNSPPREHAWGMAIGHESDHFNNIMTIVWSYGGAIANAKGEPAFNSPDTVRAIDLIKHQYVDLKIIPRRGWAATVTSYNNELYQTKAAATVINPTSIYGWLQVNDRKLLADTHLYAPPSGPRGSFAEAGVWAWAVMKRSRDVDAARDAIWYFMEPDRYAKVLDAVPGRWVPAFRGMLDTDFWRTGEFSQLARIAINARTRAYPVGAASWRDHVENTFVLSDMLHRVCVEGIDTAEAVGWAQIRCEAAYRRLGI